MNETTVSKAHDKPYWNGNENTMQKIEQLRDFGKVLRNGMRKINMTI